MGITFSDVDVDTDENTVQLAALTPTDNAVIIGNGTAWVAESGATLKTSLGLTIGTDVQAYNANLTSWAAVTPGSYLTTSAAAAAYQPLDADLTAWAAVNPSSYSTTAQIAAAYQPLDADLTSWAGVTRAAGFDTFAATPSSANLISVITDETGTGALVFGTSPTITTPRIVGVASNSSATAGDVGEYLTGTRASGSAVSLTNDTALSIASISLPAGDYEVTVKIFFTLGASTTVTSLISSVSSTNNTLDLGLENFSNTRYPSGSILGSANDPSSLSGPVRVSLNSTTTYYAVARASFGASTATAYGYIRARRVR